MLLTEIDSTMCPECGAYFVRRDVDAAVRRHLRWVHRGLALLR
jgi:hypothetical protein